MDSLDGSSAPPGLKRTEIFACQTKSRPQEEGDFGGKDIELFDLRRLRREARPALAISALAIGPLRWASRPASSGKVSKMPNRSGPSLTAYQGVVAGSATARG